MHLYSKDISPIKNSCFTRIFSILLMTIFCIGFSGSGHAQLFEQHPKESVGMKKMVITPPQNATITSEHTIEKSQGLPPPPENEKTNNAPQKRPKLSPEKALTKQENLKAWSPETNPLLVKTEWDIDLLIKELESNAELATPTTLLQSAKTLAEQNHMKEAAKYLFVAQARLQFDEARWPGNPSKSQENVKYMNKNKGEDQKLPWGEKPLKQENPHNSVIKLSATISPAILEWTFKDSGNFISAITAAREWDEATAFSYKPEYDTQEPIPYKDWAKQLDLTREEYYSSIIHLHKTMKKFKGD